MLGTNEWNQCPFCGVWYFDADSLERHRPACYLALAEVENRKTSILDEFIEYGGEG